MPKTWGSAAQAIVASTASQLQHWIFRVYVVVRGDSDSNIMAMPSRFFSRFRCHGPDWLTVFWALEWANVGHGCSTSGQTEATQTSPAARPIFRKILAHAQTQIDGVIFGMSLYFNMLHHPTVWGPVFDLCLHMSGLFMMPSPMLCCSEACEILTISTLSEMRKSQYTG